ncbi:MAG: DUF1847 domain-containing protein [Desulfobacterales bacterium]
MKKTSPNCARCPYNAADRICRRENGKAPDFCPTVQKTDLIEKSLAEYKNDPGLMEFARQSALQEAEGYANRECGYDRVRPSMTRIEEIMAFARKMKYKRLGLAFCIGLRREAAVVEKIFSAHGFEVISVVCKAGRTPKEEIGIADDQKIALGKFETMCNPVLQAMVLNQESTELNVMLGLCVGHDSLFLKYAKAPCTVLAVKDRVLGHNPLAAIYQAESYYRSLPHPA